ncbi:MAG: hypothetical protein ACJ8F7_11550, partial [Gemmataceae bacterium]
VCRAFGAEDANAGGLVGDKDGQRMDVSENCDRFQAGAVMLFPRRCLGNSIKTSIYVLGI